MFENVRNQIAKLEGYFLNDSGIWNRNGDGTGITIGTLIITCMSVVLLMIMTGVIKMSKNEWNR